MTIARVLYLALLFALCGVPVVCAQEAVMPVDHYPPWKFTEGRDDVAGIDIQVAKALLGEVGLSPKYLKMPWKRCLAAMEEGEGDIMNGVLRSPERETYLYFLEPPYKNKTVKVFYVLKGSGTAIGRYEDLRGLTIGTTLGVKYFERFDADRTLSKDVVKYDPINLRKLAAGHIDCFIATEETGDYLIRKEGLDGRIVKAAFRIEEPANVYFVISRKSRLMERAPELSEALRRMVETGTVDRMIGEYLRGM